MAAATGYEEIFFTARDGLRLYARHYPAKRAGGLRPVLCLAGLTRNSRDFETVSPYIAETGRRVLAIDVRGRGLSARDPKPMQYTPLTYARDVQALMDQAGITQEIALIYKKRWEVLFRFLKQEMNLTHYVCNEPAAIKAMVYCTLIVGMLILI